MFVSQLEELLRYVPPAAVMEDDEEEVAFAQKYKMHKDSIARQHVRTGLLKNKNNSAGFQGTISEQELLIGQCFYRVETGLQDNISCQGFRRRINNILQGMISRQHVKSGFQDRGSRYKFKK